MATMAMRDACVLMSVFLHFKPISNVVGQFMELQIDSLHFLLHATLLSAATRRYGNRKVHQRSFPT